MSTTETQALTDVADVNPPVKLGRLPGDTMVSFISMADVSNSGHWVRHQERRLGDVLAGYTPFVEGDLLFAKITPCMENGKGAHAKGLVNGIGFGSTEFHVLRVKGRNSDRFLFHWLQEPVVRIRAIAYMGGSAGQQRVKAQFFSQFRIPLIPPEEQVRIASVLDMVDTGISQIKEIISKLRNVRAGVLHDLLTRGLDEHGEVRVAASRPDDFRDSCLGKIPSAWSLETLGERLQRNSGFIQTGPFGSQLHANEYTTEGVPVIMPQDIREGTFDITRIARISSERARQLQRHRVRTGDLIFARRGDLSRCAVVTQQEENWLCGTGCLLMRFERRTLCPDWLSLAYRHDFGQRQITARAVGTTMVNLNTSLLDQLVFAFPEKREQEQIAQRVREVDATIQVELGNLAKLELLRFGLAGDLLTGRVPLPQNLEITMTTSPVPQAD